MLNNLRIRNFAIIEDLSIPFKSGLNILTGETGAGKSILIDALSGVLGDKMTTDMIRTGYEKASLEGTFDIRNLPWVEEILDNSGIDMEDDVLVLKRDLFSSGRGRCFANGTQIPIAKLKEISACLVDIHGQNEHQSIMKVSRHRELLDSFGRHQDDVKEIRELHSRLQDIRERLESSEIDEREKERRIEYNTFAINEIDSAGLVSGEEDQLKNESMLLANSEKLFKEINRASAILNDEEGVLQKLRKIDSGLVTVSEYDTDISNVLENVKESLYSLEDASSFLRSYEEGIDFSPQRINEVEARIALISGLRKKYGDTVEDVLAYAEKAKKELEVITSGDEEMEKNKREYKEILKKAKETAFSLSDKRKKSAMSLEKSVMKELNDLGMTGTVFHISIVKQEAPDGEIESENKRYILYPHGLDRIEFLLAANSGEELRQLRKVASGGEMSRIMLALKNVILSADLVESLVFDEVDTGISGKTAEIVGKKLKTLSADRQVMVITHLPQIAAMSDCHFSVSKQEDEGRVTTDVKCLSTGDKIREVARMLAGETVTELSIRHAEEMVAMAGQDAAAGKV